MRAEHDASGTGGAPGGAPRPKNGTRAAADPGPGKTPGPGQPAGPGQSAARSRRFPTVTQDTARPEGGGRAIPGAVSTPARQWPMLSVLAATAVGLLTTAVGQARVGCLVIGVALIAAAVMRRVLPSVGMLAVRSRFTDMITYGVLGVAITLLALVMEPGPWLHLPFLESAVRFTVR
ncbi:DUF3017 domain-containing protein [Streptomyces sp. WAC07061]|uniref:DUF3017 domain-containing protein n=1 Tax=Streptomyces sp. WAC07061 TaxID=2487410 RepID=UPI000F76F7B0|nr:DUF3017 domain-containing protein [Streptomyces sp. WAC07061]RSS50070.1 DUF3017 domain-containing protein [Streptomyces sp. WAC07061]